MIRERASFSLCPAVTVDTSRRASATTSVGKSKVMGKIKQEGKRPRKLPWLPKLTPTKDNDHHSPTLWWSFSILDMELRKNGLEVGESIYWISLIYHDIKDIRFAGEMTPKTVRSNLIMQTYMSQFDHLNSPCQEFNAHHPQHQKWVND